MNAGNTTNSNKAKLHDRRGKGRKDGDPAGALAADLDRHKAVGLRLQGHTYREIGAALGVSGKTAFNYVNDGWERVLTETDEQRRELRDLELARLDAMLKRAMPLATLDNLLMIETDATGIEVRRDAAELQLKAMDRALKISKRRSELLGLDASQKLEQTGSSTLIPLAELAARVAARRAEAEAAAQAQQQKKEQA